MSWKLAAVCLVAALAGAAPSALNSPRAERVEGLRSGDAEVRQAAKEGIVKDYDETIAALEGVIQQALGDKDWGEINGELLDRVSLKGEPVPAKYLSAASAIQALGELRAVRSVPLLVRHFGFRPSYRIVFDTASVLEDYPAALALANIGVPSLERVLELYKERPRDVRSIVWMMLDKVLGPDLQREYVLNAIAAEKNPEKQEILREILPGAREARKTGED